MRTMTFAFAALLAAAPLLAQPAQPRRAARTVLTDDDDGRVEVYRRGDAPAAAGTPAIRRPVIEILFAGPGWDAQVKQDLIDEVRGFRMPDGVQPLSIAGTHDVAGGETAMNDLHVQRIIDRGMADGSLPVRDDSAIYIVFLGRGVRSTLGASRATSDYDSYHSHFHAHETEVRYVVVPWNDDRGTMRDAARESASRAIE